MDLHLNGHTVVVTGGASGIGRATAECFAAEGARVAIWDVAAGVEDVAAEIASPAGVQVLGACVDVTDPKTIDEALKQTTSALGSVDHLVHAAGTGSGKFGYPFTNLDPNDWYRTLHVNINGMVNIAHALTPAMVERERGSMVFVASVAGQIGSQTDPPYSASKAANINFAQCMARDLAGQGVRVNTVNPGMVKTPLNRAVWESWNAQQPPEEQRSYEDWADEKVRTVVPLGRWQTPRDIADTIVFLSSDRAHNITGQTINVDGGYVMHW